MAPRIVELAKKSTLLQVALDYTSLADALGLAARLRRELPGQPLAYEAGTPLIKAEGLSAVRLLRSVVDPAPVVADMKTADTGALEARMAAEAGASATTVLGSAPLETIEDAVREAKRHGVAVAVDLIGVADPAARAEELAALGVDIVEVHVGIDVQRRLGLTAADMAGIVSRIAERFPGVVAVAGGLNEETAPKMVEAGARIVIVGGAITRSKDPIEAARRILARIKRMA